MSCSPVQSQNMLAPKVDCSGVCADTPTTAAQLPLPSMPAYCASKAALASFADTVRPELALSGIHLTQVHPGALAACSEPA